jgi:hypothetical protein
MAINLIQILFGIGLYVYFRNYDGELFRESFMGWMVVLLLAFLELYLNASLLMRVNMRKDKQVKSMFTVSNIIGLVTSAMSVMFYAYIIFYGYGHGEITSSQ